MDTPTNAGRKNEPATPPQNDPTSLPDELLALAQALITTRHHVSPKRLVEPGPTADQLHDLFTLAAAAPDHGLLTPWRFVIVPGDKRHLLGEVFAQALVDRDPAAAPEQIEEAREKAARAPLLMVAIACLDPREPNTPPLERMISMGAAIQNLMLGAHAMGFGCGLTSGRAMASPRLRALLQLADEEEPVCCVNIGTVGKRKAGSTVRPAPGNFTTVL